MKTQEEIVQSLREDIRRMSFVFQQAGDTIRNENVSNYPLFVAYHENPNVGISLIKAEEAHSNWSYHASTLEELVSKKIISEVRVDNFRQLYKRNIDQLCMMVVHDGEAHFIFTPY